MLQATAIFTGFTSTLAHQTSATSHQNAVTAEQEGIFRRRWHQLPSEPRNLSYVAYWNHDPHASICEFKDQLNYVHLQDWTGPIRSGEGMDRRIWCAVGEGNACDFPGILKVLKEINYDRWGGGVPGIPKPGREDSLSMAQDSSGMYEYMRGVGY